MAEIPHRTQTGLNAAHPPAYASESDPTTTLGAHRWWVKPSTGVVKRRNAANTDWEDISIEGTSAGSAPSLADLSDVDVVTTAPADGEALVWDDTAGEWVPGSVAAGSVDAADVAYAGGTGMSATNVESAIDELATEKANDSALTAHIDDTADAHDASAISYAGGAGMSATHVEAAIDELATEKANDSALSAHTADTTDAHDASAISIVDAGTYFTAADVEGALQELGAGGGGGGAGVAVEEDSAEEGTSIDRFDFTTNMDVAVSGTQATISTYNYDNAPFSRSGTLTTGVGVGRFPVPVAATIVEVRAMVNTAPTGASIIVDVNKNGTTIFTTQGNRPTIAASATSSGAVTNMDVTSLAAGDYLTVDVDQIGSTIAGADLVVLVRYRY